MHDKRYADDLDVFDDAWCGHNFVPLNISRNGENEVLKENPFNLKKRGRKLRQKLRMEAPEGRF